MCRNNLDGMEFNQANWLLIRLDQHNVLELTELINYLIKNGETKRETYGESAMWERFIKRK